MIPEAIEVYNTTQSENDQKICVKLSELIDGNLRFTEAKIWHAHPVWFIEGNPIVGYSKQKKGIRLMFWSGKSFNEEKLNVKGEKFQDASIFYNDSKEIDEVDIKSWLIAAEEIQWDYKNLIKRKGELIKLKG